MSNSCYHCQLPIDSSLKPIISIINEENQEFCCFGCKSVCEAIYHSGMEGFYQRTNEQSPLAPPPEISQDFEIFDLDEIQSEYVSIAESIRKIQLLVEGIHCAACVWLIEKRLSQLDGIEKVSVNLTTKSLQLTWNNDVIKLSQVLAALAEIGYGALPYDPEIAEGKLKKQNRDLLYRLGFAGFAAMNLMWIAIALYSGADEGEFKRFFYWLGLGIATPTLLYSAAPFFKSAYIGLKNRHMTMDLPIAIGAFSTWAYSVYVTVWDIPGAEVYFDTVVNFIFVILVGRFLESVSKRQAVSTSQRLLDLQPKVATLLCDGEPSIVPIKTIKMDDVVLVKPGERIAVDGVIIKGSTEIDESMLTGESYPVMKIVDDSVSAGTNNKEGVIEVRVTKILKDSALGKIIHLVDEAQSSKAPIQCTADKVVPWFVSITLILAVATFAFWVNEDFEKALLAATSVLIITCPCAFGLATPMAIAVSTGVGAKMGLLIKHGGVLETLSSIDHFVFDKTGTLTEGNIKVTEVLDYSDNQQTILKSAYQLERLSEHPVARSIVNYVISSKIKILPAEVENIVVLAGQGIKAKINGKLMVIGNRALLSEYVDVTEVDVAIGKSTVYCYLEGLGYLVLIVEDKIKKDAKDVVTNMLNSGLDVTLLSGDKKEIAENTANTLGIRNCLYEVKPDEKEASIQSLQKQGGLIAMVGDGINDAPALVRADVGIAMDSGTDISIDSADIVLLDGQLNKIPLASALSKRTLLTIKQNIGLSIVYNVVMVPLAMMAMITPLVAAIAMPISSLLVIANASRIHLYFSKNKRG